MDQSKYLNLTRAVGGQRARLYAAYSHKALFHYTCIALKNYYIIYTIYVNTNE